MMHLVTLGILWTAICMAHGDQAAKLDSAVCNTTECQKLVSQIKDQRGDSNPCQDFHNYVCGKWQGSKELKERKLKEKALTDLIALLEGTPSPSGMEFNATGKLVSAYKSCTEAGEEEKLRQAVSSVLATYGFTRWPVLEENDAVENYSYKEILKLAGPRPIFEYFVSIENSTPTITMSKPREFFVDALGDIDQIFGSSVSARGDETDSTTVDYSAYDDYDRKADEAYEEFITEVMQLLNKTLNRERISETAKNIIEFEKQLYNFSSQATMKTSEKTIREIVDAMGDNIPLDEILEKDFSVINFTINNDTKIKWEYQEYYVNTAKYVREPKKILTLMNYIMWVIVRGMSRAEGTPLHKLYLQYKNKTSILPIAEEGKDTKMRCIHQLLERSVMYSAFAHFYSKAKFDEESKQEVMKILHYVNTTFQYIIENNGWMSNPTKVELLQRLNNITFVIGYPGWLMDDGIINKLYMFVPTIQPNDSFVKHYHYLQQNNHYQKLLMLNSSLYVDKRHEDITLRSHAYYDEARNTAAYPAAALATNFRKRPVPRATNFGTVGTILAQLLTSTMDRYQKQHLSNGSYVKKDFWDKNTTSAFCQNSMCLNNSQECRGENDCYSNSHQKIEDYFGLRVSHKALQRSKNNYSEPFLLPDDSLDTEDKIFFGFFGSLYCPYSLNTRKPSEKPKGEERVQERAEEEGFSFSKSLNEVVSIYNYFNNTFNCTGGITDTCQLIPEEQLSNVGC